VGDPGRAALAASPIPGAAVRHASPVAARIPAGTRSRRTLTHRSPRIRARDPRPTVPHTPFGSSDSHPGTRIPAHDHAPHGAFSWRHIMKLGTRLLLTCLTLAVSVALVRPAAYAQVGTAQIDSTHYWTYHLLQTQFFPQPIQVSDQFFPNFIPVEVDTLERLVNWVVKNHSPVRDTLVHFTWWNIPEKLPVGRDVTVDNQFGKYNVNIRNLEFLLAPAFKNFQTPDPTQTPNASHYLCYRASGFPPPTQLFSLFDEWRQDLLPIGPLEYLCTPCIKEHQGRLFFPIDTVTHLALYQINPQSDYFYPFVQDQFLSRPEYVQQHPIEYLLVPSKKTLIVTEPKRTTWGKVKTLYR
jgi:hypothetical protein